MFQLSGKALKLIKHRNVTAGRCKGAGKCLNQVANYVFNKLHRQKSWDRVYSKEWA